MTTTERDDILNQLFTTTEQKIAEIDRDLSAVYLSRWPFCVVLEDCSMGVAYNDLEGVTPGEPYYHLSSRPADCSRFSREDAEKIATAWNSDPARPRVVVMGHRDFYQRMRAVLQGVLAPFTAAREQQPTQEGASHE